MTRRIRTIALVSVVGLWATAVVGAMGLLMRSSATPDLPAEAHARWPDNVDLPRPSGEPTYVVCLHPRCPCSEATVDALIAFLGSATNSHAYVLFAVPPGAGKEWVNTDLIARTKAVDGLHVLIDDGGTRCAALGARTSGQVFVYDGDGRLAFSGGITPGRGERGDSDGLQLMKAAIAGKALPSQKVTTAVFGCALYRPANRPPAVEAPQ